MVYQTNKIIISNTMKNLTNIKHALASGTKGVQVFIIVAILASVIGIYQYGMSAESLLLILAGYFVYGCLGIVVTFHRKLTHDSYSSSPFLTKALSVVGCLAGTGSPIAWVAIHINHHLKSDTPEDPHSPLYKGLRIFRLEYEDQVSDTTKWRMRKLITDPFYQFLHRYYFGIMIVYDVVLFLIGGLYLVVFAHLLPATITALMSNIVNYVGHKPTWLGGYRSFNLKDQSTNNWLWAVPSWGESWHNNHHRYPKNNYFGQKWWEVDISGLIIKLIKI
jgi:stearoyl-CoA desaturase (delta-9 desaturase)